jgi:hypothetical protein
MDLDQVKRLYHTLRHLKFIQVYYQLKYRLVRPKRVVTPINGVFAKVDLIDFPEKLKSLSINKSVWSFSFLNCHHSFSKDVLDWSFGEYGMLWTYNLNYFDWLHQPGMTKEHGLETLSQFYSTRGERNSIILHSYPTSLRIINTAKFVSKWNITEDSTFSDLLSDLKFLGGRLEYHLLANHLLENAFALYIGGLITNQSKFVQKGKKLLVRELKEQVLSDGMHYERSPMYHLIILERLLDALNFAKACGDDLEPVLQVYAVTMTGLAMNWEDLDRIPMMQDSAYGIALSLPEILEYSERLLAEAYPLKPNDFMDSGYRRLNAANFALIANVGSISPSYQPGHAHSDELNFELFYQGVPIIVDTGTSTYENNSRRNIERSTQSHNCVVIENKNSSDVWSSFRVGKRAKVELKKEYPFIEAQCKSNNSNIKINRRFSLTGDCLTIHDKYSPEFYMATGQIHFHPDISLVKASNNMLVLKHKKGLKLRLKTLKCAELKLESFEYSKGFNRTVKAIRVKYKFSENEEINLKVSK